MEHLFALWFLISFWLNLSVSPLMLYISMSCLLRESPFHSFWKDSSNFTHKTSPQVKVLYQKSKSCTSRNYSSWEFCNSHPKTETFLNYSIPQWTTFKERKKNEWCVIRSLPTAQSSLFLPTSFGNYWLMKPTPVPISPDSHIKYHTTLNQLTTEF